MTSKRELESVSAVLMLLAGIFLLLGPIEVFAGAISHGSLDLNLVDLILAVLAIVCFAITWKGNSTIGGLLGLIISLYMLFGRGVGGGFGSAAAAFLLAGGIIAMLAGRSPTPVYTQR